MEVINEEEEDVIVEDCGYPDRNVPMDMRGKTPFNYKGDKPLADPRQEEYIHNIVRFMGDRRKAYEVTYYPNIVSPQYSPRTPWRFFERKGFLLRYNYVMNEALHGIGLDKSTLLVKAAGMIDKAVQGNKVKDFTSLVDTVLKLQVDASKYTAINQSALVSPSKDDLKQVKELMESLNG